MLYTIGDGSGNYDEAKIAVLSLQDMHSDVQRHAGRPAFVILRREKPFPTLQINAITGLFDNLAH